MKNTIVTVIMGIDLLLLWVATACDPFMSKDSFDPTRNQTWVNPEKPEIKLSSGDVLSVALSFPSDYDWRRDTSYGSVNARVLFQCNGKTLYSFEAGSESCISVDADGHHILDGRLYSEGHDADSTYVYRDGEPYLSFPGRERLRGLLHRDGGPYILSQNRNGEGFVLRFKDEIKLERESGTLIGDFLDPLCAASGALYEDSGDVCFRYYRTDKSGEKEWFFVKNGEDAPAPVPQDASIVYDIRLIAGKTCSVYRDKSGHSPVFSIDGQRSDLSKTVRNLSVNNDYRIIPFNGSPSFLGTYSERGTHRTITNIWDAKKIIKAYGGECAAYSGAEGSAIFVYGQNNGTVYSPSGNFSIESGLRLMTNRCAECDGSGFHMALSPTSPLFYPELWHDGESSVLKINGFYAAIEVLD